MADRQFVLRSPTGGSALLDDAQLRGPSLVSHTGAAALTGTGSSTIAGVRIRFGAAALTGAGTATIAGVASKSGAAALTGVGSSTIAGQYVRIGTAALTGAGTLTATGTLAASGAASLSGVGTMAFWMLPPRNLVGIPIGVSRVDLSWDESLGASTYDVERDGVVIVADVPTNEYSDTGLVAETEYTYRVRAAA